MFVDHVSRLSFIYLQTSTSSEETLQAKRAFEIYARSFGVYIKHYHADNGRFADNAWLRDIQAKGQGISYCGVSAHHQNGIAEKRIRDLSEQARTMMLQSSSKWKRAHSVSLWPYAIRMANDVINSTPRTDKSEKMCRTGCH